MIAHEADRQYACLQVIKAFDHRPPTRAELGEQLGISKVSAHLLVKKLESQKLVYVTPGCWRNVWPTEKGLAVDEQFFSILAQRARNTL